MKDENISRWGAKIERGKIEEAETSGQETVFTVSSYDRPGVTGRRLKSFATGCAAGDIVYFFLFDDGKGAVIGKA